MKNFEVTICRVAVDKIIHLRHRILRAGLPFETAHFPGDLEPETWHFGSFLKAFSAETAEVVCCASFMLNAVDNEPAWQLRGMATEPRFQGLGVGKALLAHAEESILAASNVRFFWCNARVPAVPFYEKQRWKCVSEVFDIPTAGPHRKMVKRLPD